MQLTSNLFLEVLALVFFGLAMTKTPEPVHLSYGWAAFFILDLVLIFGGVKL